MNIIPNNYEKILKELIFNQISSKLSKILFKRINGNQVNKYIDVISNLDEELCSIAKNSLITIFETIDNSYCNSVERKSKYYIKAHHTRTILTIFGEITINRTFYSFKDNSGSFCYLDRFLGLKKHDYFDPYIKALIVEYSANNSIPTVCSILNELIGNRIKMGNKIKYLNRQTVRNIILDAKIAEPEIKQLPTPETIYIIADEKWIATQNNDGKKVMAKSMVIFDGIGTKPRRHLLNKRIFSSFSNNDFLNDALDYLYYAYKLDDVKNIFIMGDGAKWIRALPAHFKVNINTNIIFALDKFHFKQSIHHIGQNKDLEEMIANYVIYNNKKAFKDFCNAYIESFPHREETITKKKEYILSNWKNISNLYEYKLSCPMESQISHNLAYLFTSRPKGYSLEMLRKMLKIRLLYKNNEDIKKLYLENYNKKEIIKTTNNNIIINFKSHGLNINYSKLIKEPFYKIPFDGTARIAIHL